MKLNMNDSHIISLTQIKEILKLNDGVKFKSSNKEETYFWIENVLLKFKYFGLRKKDKGIVKNYIKQMTGLSDTRTKKLISRKKKFRKLWLGSCRKHHFPKKYTTTDIARLIETDNLHLRLSGPATQEILKREYKIFHREPYKNISNISISHIYNLRETRQYISHSLTVKKTNPNKVPIGERRKPEPQGKPGYLRIDSVHQGDLEKEKGVYHINITDEVLQWEIIGCVEKISEHYLLPLLEDLILQFPYMIINFHSDNGSEYINKMVVGLLNKLLIKQTKSRARHCNDNALAECKNGRVIRKHIGYSHIPQKYAPLINQFYREFFNPYLNYHRPCGFATIVEDEKKKGKFKKKYDIYMTPYQRLKSLPDGEQYLKHGICFAILDKIAYEKSDNEFAALMQKEKKELFDQFNKHKLQFPTFYASFISGSYVD